MPAFIANCSWHGHCKEDPLGCEGYWCTQCNDQGVGPVVNPSAPACKSLEFHYQGIKQLPHDLGPWYELVRATVAHTMERYGPGAAAPLAKVTGMIVTVRVRLRAAGGCKAPPSRPAQRKFCGV